METVPNSHSSTMEAIPNSQSLTTESVPSSQSAPLPQKKYHLHIDIEPGYEPAFKRRSRNGLQPTVAAKEQMRSLGLKHIDLWCDCSLYPIEPFKWSHPPFSNPTTLLKFVGDGHSGLLGYCNALRGEAATYSCQIRLLMEEISSLRNEVQLQQATVQQHVTEISLLKKQVNGYRQKETTLGVRARKRKLRNVEELKLGSGGLKKRIQAIK